MLALFKLFYAANDFNVFYMTALWARVYVNEGQFIFALYNAVLRRPDTKYLQLPQPYEMYPYAFFNSEVLEKAHHPKIYGKLGNYIAVLFIYNIIKYISILTVVSVRV